MRMLFALICALLIIAPAGAAGPHPWPPSPSAAPAGIVAPPFSPRGADVVRWVDGSNADAVTLFTVGLVAAPLVPLPADGSVALAVPAEWAGETIVAARAWYGADGEVAWWDVRLVSRPRVALPLVVSP